MDVKGKRAVIAGFGDCYDRIENDLGEILDKSGDIVLAGFGELSVRDSNLARILKVVLDKDGSSFSLIGGAEPPEKRKLVEAIEIPGGGHLKYIPTSEALKKAGIFINITPPHTHIDFVLEHLVNGGTGHYMEKPLFSWDADGQNREKARKLISFLVEDPSFIVQENDHYRAKPGLRDLRVALRGQFDKIEKIQARLIQDGDFENRPWLLSLAQGGSVGVIDTGTHTSSMPSYLFGEHFIHPEKGYKENIIIEDVVLRIAEGKNQGKDDPAVKDLIAKVGGPLGDSHAYIRMIINLFGTPIPFEMEAGKFMDHEDKSITIWTHDHVYHLNAGKSLTKAKRDSGLVVLHKTYSRDLSRGVGLETFLRRLDAGYPTNLPEIKEAQKRAEFLIDCIDIGRETNGPPESNTYTAFEDPGMIPRFPVGELDFSHVEQ